MLPKKLFFRALLALFVGTCLIVVWAYLNFLSDLKSFRSVYKAFNLISEETSFPKLDPSISGKGRLLLRGDEHEGDLEKRWRALHLEEPENPAYYSFYLQKVNKIPEDFERVVQSIDPENGWFHFFRITVESKENVSRKRKKKKGDFSDAIKYEVKDEKILDKSITELEAALKFPKFNSYTRELSEEKFEVIPRPVDYQSNLNKVFTLGRSFVAAPSVKMYSIRLLSAGLERAQTKTEFERLETIALALMDRTEEEFLTLIDVLIARATRSALSKDLSLAAGRLGLSEKESFYEKQREHFASRAKRIEARSLEGSQTSEILEKYGSAFTAMSGPSMLRLVESETSFTATDFQPGQRLERAYFSQAFYIHAFMVIAFVVVYLLFTGRKIASDEKFVGTTMFLMKAVIMPFLILLLGRYFLSFGVLDFGFRPTGGINYLLLEMTTFQFLLTVILCWHRSQALPERSCFRCWWPVILAMLSYTSAIAMPHFPVIEKLAIGLVAIQTIWLFAMVGTALSKEMSEGLANERRTLAYAFMTLAILIGLSIMGLEQEKSYWFEKTELEKATPHNLTLLEEKIVEVAKKELAEFPSFTE